MFGPIRLITLTLRKLFGNTTTYSDIYVSPDGSQYYVSPDLSIYYSFPE